MERYWSQRYGQLLALYKGGADVREECKFANTQLQPLCDDPTELGQLQSELDSLESHDRAHTVGIVRQRDGAVRPLYNTVLGLVALGVMGVLLIL